MEIKTFRQFINEAARHMEFEYRKNKDDKGNTIKALVHTTKMGKPKKHSDVEYIELNNQKYTPTQTKGKITSSNKEATEYKGDDGGKVFVSNDFSEIMNG